MPDIRVQDEQGTVHVFPDGSTPEMIAKAMNVKPPTPQPLTQPQAGNPNDPWRGLSQATGLRAAPAMFSKEWFKQKALNIGLGVADTLPGVGATGGAMIGATGGTALEPGGGTFAGGVGGAGIGGMGGEAAKQLMYRAFGWPYTKTPEEAASSITKEGAIQGGLQAATEGLSRVAPFLRNSATTQYERALAPTTKINKAITKDVAPELIERGEYGSLQGLENKATQKISTLNPQLNASYQQAPNYLPGAGTKVIQDLENLKQSYMPGGNVAQPQAVSAIEGVQNIVKQYGPDIQPTTLRRLRQIFEDPVAQRGAYAGADISTNYTLSAQKQAADSIRGILNKNPDIGALNKEISFWLDVQRVTSQSALRQTGQQGGLLKVLSPLAAGAAATTTGMKFGATQGLEVGVATALTTAAYQAIRSPMWRTASAVLKDRFAQALARGSVGEVTALLARFGVAAQESKQSRTQGNPTAQQLQFPGQQP